MSRRKNGEGTIYSRAYKTRRGGFRSLWVGELTLGYSEGKRIKKSYSSRDIEALKRALNNGKYIVDQLNAETPPFVGCSYTVDGWVSHYLTTYKTPVLKASTYDRYESAFICHISPGLGAINLAAVTADEIQLFYNSLREKGLKNNSIKKVHIVLNGAFKQAVNLGHIPKNPCASAVIPKTATRETRALSAAEQTAFESACPKTVYGDFFVFALYTGLRVGEAAALEWADVDMERKVIKVNKTAASVRTRKGRTVNPAQLSPPARKFQTITTPPKSKRSVREVPICRAVYELLAGRLARLSADRLAHQRDAGTDAGAVNAENPVKLVFPSAANTPLRYRNLRRAFQTITRNSGITANITIHTLRHTFATRLIEKGADVKSVSELLGHASVKFTLDVYTHAAKEAKAAAVALLDD